MDVHREYELLIDLPSGEKKGSRYFMKTKGEDAKVEFVLGTYSEHSDTWYSYSVDRTKTTFSVEQVMDEKFFKPHGKKVPIVPKFPSYKKIDEFYHLIGENRLVDDVDEVRAINPIFYSEEFKKGVYDLLRKMYKKKYFNE